MKFYEMPKFMYIKLIGCKLIEIYLELNTTNRKRFIWLFGPSYLGKTIMLTICKIIFNVTTLKEDDKDHSNFDINARMVASDDTVVKAFR